MDNDYYLVNVFSEAGIRGGNQLAVFPNGSKYSTEDMEGITRNFNFSETTFVTRIDENEADVRIFTPGGEIPYAGHPTIGTITVLEYLNHIETGNKRERFYLNLKGGKVLGKINYGTDTTNPIQSVYFQQLSPELVGIFDDQDLLLDNLGLKSNDLADDTELLIIKAKAMKFVFVQLNSPELLHKIAPNYIGLAKGIFKEQDISPYVFAKGGLDGGDYRARFFVPLYDIPEDPATGGVQGSFGLALLKLGLLNSGENKITIEQGYEMGRPSKIYDIFTVEDNELIMAETGGNTYFFAKGNLFTK